MISAQMSCDTFCRLAKLARTNPDDNHPSFTAIRISGNMAVSTNRMIMAVERLHTPCAGVMHIAIDPSLLIQCEIERLTNGSVAFYEQFGPGTVRPITTNGWGNDVAYDVAYKGEIDSDWDRVPEIFAEVRKSKPVKNENFGMYIDTTLIQVLIDASPSKHVYFENVPFAGNNRPTIIRDAYSADWFGVFHAYRKEQHFPSASIPGWVS